MKIVVCIKQVPDTTEVRLDPKTCTLVRDGVPSIINPDDKTALEAALQMKDAGQGITVTALCMGPAQADTVLREALAMGCDEVVLVSGREFGGSDTYATATILAAALKEIGFDLVLTGRQAIDGNTAQVGPQIAERLGLAQVSYAQKMKLEENAVLVQRQYEDCYHVVRAKLPCLITVLSELAVPRYMTVAGTQDAYEKTVGVLGFEDLKGGLNPEWIGLAGSPTNVVQSYTKQPRAQGVLMEDLSFDEAAELIAGKLAEMSVI